MANKAPKFIGVDTRYRTADGNVKTRIHMDGAASPLAAKAGVKAIKKLLPHYSNTHSYVHSSAKLSTQALARANQQILNYVGADSKDYTAIFCGAGTTAGINRVARGLAAARPERKHVLVSAMEHHANDLPHRQFDNQVHYIPTTGDDITQGAIDLDAFEQLLKQHQGRINYVAVSSVSNVTGIINPITEMTELAHRYDTLMLVDAAQAVAHLEHHISRDDANKQVDFLVFSGHKVYTPMAPGVLIAKKSVIRELSEQDLGGGSVEDVSYQDYVLLDSYPDREQSGTPNIVGAVALASTLKRLNKFGKHHIEQHSLELSQLLLDELGKLPFLTVYGDSQAKRISAVSFNHQQIDHGLLAAILNDYFAIAVRNECFCAHPYVSSMLKQTLWEIDLDGVPEEQQTAYINRKRGMVRASISLYNNQQHIKALIEALKDIDQNIAEYQPHYQPKDDGSYVHKSYKIDWSDYLDI